MATNRELMNILFFKLLGYKRANERIRKRIRLKKRCVFSILQHRKLTDAERDLYNKGMSLVYAGGY